MKLFTTPVGWHDLRTTWPLDATMTTRRNKPNVGVPYGGGPFSGYRLHFVLSSSGYLHAPTPKIHRFTSNVNLQLSSTASHPISPLHLSSTTSLPISPLHQCSIASPSISPLRRSSTTSPPTSTLT